MVWLVVGFAAGILLTLIENAVYERSARVDPANTPGTDEYDLRYGDEWKRKAVLDMIGDRAARRTRPPTAGPNAPNPPGSRTASVVAKGTTWVALRIWRAWKALEALYVRVRTT